MSVLGLASLYTTLLYAKTSKNIVKFQTTPKDWNSCGICIHLIAATNECNTVDGWCTIYFKQPDNKEG